MLHLTENAAKQIKSLQDADGTPGLMLRVRVDGGGCSGFQYAFSLDQEVHDDDTVFEEHGVKVVSDEASLPFLEEAEIDYVTELIGAAFVVRNPNASSSCGCGNSFSI